ncbi:hypothetical protein G210_0061 [Candida maltosa Xu316]|uniref:Uncharacterized protein n=1 Tax=Candida maltosa (strain Xu316) TaxID=1245528 RepID=M3IRU7_CANMX|nr:hypothetical protein G210_0061 [Candida maltosa Xu316]
MSANKPTSTNNTNLQNPAMSPTPQNNTTTNPDNTVTDELLTLQHLKNYPVLTSTKTAIELIPLSKSVFSIMGSSFSMARSYQPMKYIIGKSDIYANRALDELDKWLPNLQTVEVQDITNPITKPVSSTVETVQKQIVSVNESVNKNFVEPTKSALGTVKEEFQSKVYDAEGKGIITSQADPVVAPFNESLEQFVENHFPNSKKVPVEGHSSEISRTFKIMGNMISRNDNSGKSKAK